MQISPSSFIRSFISTYHSNRCFARLEPTRIGSILRDHRVPPSIIQPKYIYIYISLYKRDGPRRKGKKKKEGKKEREFRDEGMNRKGKKGETRSRCTRLYTIETLPIHRE